MMKELETAIRNEVRQLRGAPEQPHAVDYASQQIREDIDRLTQIDADEVNAPATYTRLQTIAQWITCLTWREAELMGAAVEAKRKDGGSLTAALFEWAEGWETF